MGSMLAATEQQGRVLSMPAPEVDRKKDLLYMVLIWR